MNNKILIGVIAVLVLGIGAFALLSNKTNNPAAVSVSPTPTSSPTTTASPSGSPSASAVEEKKVTVTKNGFEPQTLKVKAGTKVTFVNNSGDTVSVNSDPHPTHTLFPFLNIGIISDGSSASVTFDKVGAFTYHNHLNPSETGTVIVE